MLSQSRATLSAVVAFAVAELVYGMRSAIEDTPCEAEPTL